MLTIPYNAKYEFSKELLQDIFSDALERGSHYWAKLHKPYSLPEAFKDGGVVIIVDHRAVKYYSIILNDVELGLRKMSEKFPEAFLALITEDWDSKTSDNFLQLVVFGEHKYG